jgi:hypothetical protein
MIADAFNHAIAGIGFICAAARVSVRKGLKAGKNTVMTQISTRWRDQRRELNISALTTAP